MAYLGQKILIPLKTLKIALKALNHHILAHESDNQTGLDELANW